MFIFICVKAELKREIEVFNVKCLGVEISTKRFDSHKSKINNDSYTAGFVSGSHDLNHLSNIMRRENIFYPTSLQSQVN